MNGPDDDNLVPIICIATACLMMLLGIMFYIGSVTKDFYK